MDESQDSKRAIVVAIGLGVVVVLLVGGFFLLNALQDDQPTDGPMDTAVQGTRTPDESAVARDVEPSPTVHTATPSPTATAPTSGGGEPSSTSPREDPTASMPTASPSVVAPTPTATHAMEPTSPGASDDWVVKLPRRNEYERAYARYWEVLTEAYATGDTSRLDEVLFGDLLEQTIQDIQANKARGRGVAMHIETKELLVATRGQTDFSMQHVYTDSSVWIDLKTGRALPRETPPDTLQQNTFFAKLDGGWKVVATNKQTVTR
jgi:hypothetical protein